LPSGMWIGLDVSQHLLHLHGLGWIGFRKLDSRLTLAQLRLSVNYARRGAYRYLQTRAKPA